MSEIGDKMSAEKKQIPIRIETELYKKLKVKATANDLSVNEYVISLISADVGNVDLSGLINE